ncbi:hypothetical protein PHYBLDRAFT_159503 [Phycomyces blakesleeanus NRRL 1555(-)]|uniref:Uncharacterized protein n=1 Tax=Phycomyces blakesleeanus (strain ATCC 8743b / DSM 1359 / FGSC 10004 / NBRC 33097 / NRRL 1555) TaxID=763407 RepID=A0A162TYW7_PHYB8|nr:hypothetical protein PHYBLDRAFT_159503 [Phycomyces blakesleeanus NRRL 1555(-)]OAD70933.1 hypothetical protein PHYBLDRAFT_159503 [Phycomyces blakesleeanus NRRL 1555(-)]|eukprot:XP_018288973.1 hypothetical protein PHYBLDRAFT_159503 [Phycomyces blakesleeanus NRRL 1555(-)]
MDIVAVKQHANWSLTSNTFERYYYKPNSRYEQVAEMVDQIIFMDTIYNTISEGAGEEAAIPVL